MATLRTGTGTQETKSFPQKKDCESKRAAPQGKRVHQITRYFEPPAPRTSLGKS